MEGSASRLSTLESTGWKPVVPNRHDAYFPSQDAAGGEIIEAAGDIG